jgi:hypothetical protein
MGVNAAGVADRRVFLAVPLLLVVRARRHGRPRPRAFVLRAGRCGRFAACAARSPYGDPAPAAAHLAELQTRNVRSRTWANIMRSTTSPGG